MKHIGIIFGIILLSAPAMADLASTTYVSTVENGLNNNISGKLDNKFNAKAGYGNKALVTTGTNGEVQPGQIASGMIADNAVSSSAQIKDGAITNAKIASGVGINKLKLPTKCTSGSCMLVYDADSGNFVWENIDRNGGSAPTGGVSGD